MVNKNDIKNNEAQTIHTTDSNLERENVYGFVLSSRIFSFFYNMMSSMPSVEICLRWSSLQSKKDQMRSEFHVVGLKIVKRLRRRKYDPVVFERTIGLVLGPSTALYRSLLRRCTLTNKAVGTIWRALSKPPQRTHGPDLPSDCYRDSFNLLMWARVQTA